MQYARLTRQPVAITAARRLRALSREHALPALLVPARPDASFEHPPVLHSR